MPSLRAEKFSNDVLQCKEKDNTFYILQGRMFQNILTNTKLKDKLELQNQTKIGVDNTVRVFSTPDFFLEGCVYWITKDESFVKVYKLKDFKVINISYEMVLVKLFFHFGIAFPQDEKKSVKDHFVCLELLKHCLVIAEGLKLTKTLKNIKAIAFSCFLSQVVNVFKATSKANFRQVNKEFVEIKEKFCFSLSPLHILQSKVSLSNLQLYLSFLDGYAHEIISFTKKFSKYQTCFYSAYMAIITCIKELVMFCELFLFVQSANANLLFIFRQTFCSKEIYKLCKTEFSEDVIDTEQSLITIRTSALVCFDWLIELVCSCVSAKFNSNEFSNVVVTSLFLNRSVYKNLQFSDYLINSVESHKEKHKKFFQSSENMMHQLEKVFSGHSIGFNSF